ncbi:MAG: hypothetical protein IKU93_06840 [Alistipes sp.]|nr:hypothetical protein [Alistipes sp.]
MKHSLFVTIALSMLLFVSCSDSASNGVAVPTRQGWHTDLPELNGDVESVVHVQYATSLKGGKLEKRCVSREVYRFNQRGDVVEKLDYLGDDSKLWSRCVYTYDEEHRMTEEAWFRGNGLLDWNTRYRYDERGVLVEEIRYNSAGVMTGRALFAYDDADRKFEEAVYDENNELQSLILSTYDDKGNLVVDAGYYVDGTIDYMWKYSYDAEGREVEFVECDVEGEPFRVTTVEYSAEGRIFTIAMSDGVTSKTKVVYEYDAKGNVVRTTQTSIVPQPSTSCDSFITEFDITYR